MRRIRFAAWRILPVALISAGIAGATMVERLSFSEMTDSSETIVAGQIADSWSEWDSEHKYIWTHYRLLVSDSVKGATSLVEIAEPGGVVGKFGMRISGAVEFQQGEKVLLFLQRMPNGYLRTAGLGQGKYSVDKAGRLHGAMLSEVEIVERPGVRRGISIEGLTLTEAIAQISGYVRQSGVRRNQ